VLGIGRRAASPLGVGGLSQHLSNIASDLPATVRFGGQWLASRTLAQRKVPSAVVEATAGRYSLHCDAEQTPNPDSRVELIRDIDEYGVPRLRVDWRYTDADVASFVSCVGLVDQGLRELSLGYIATPSDQWAEFAAEGFGVGSHHLGTTRMSSEPKHGVVDPTCRVHGVENLFIASSAVFPTSSFANPTLTIVALALRIAAEVGRLTGAGPAPTVDSAASLRVR
jgi:choline dehydrogenase-like flavoprotein